MDESIRSKRHQLSGQRPKSCARSIIFNERPHFSKEIGVRSKLFVLQPALLGSTGLRFGSLASRPCRLIDLGNGRHRIRIHDHHHRIAILVFGAHQKRTRHDLYVGKARCLQIILDLGANRRLYPYPIFA